MKILPLVMIVKTNRKLYLCLSFLWRTW